MPVLTALKPSVLQIEPLLQSLFSGISWSPLDFFPDFCMKLNTSSEALLISFMYILSLYIQSHSACDSAHCCKPFLQNYCLNISYPSIFSP